MTAVQYAKHKIRVNTVVPGQMHTPDGGSALCQAAMCRRARDELLRQGASRGFRLVYGRWRDNAHAVVSRLRRGAGSITGTEIVVDGGMTARHLMSAVSIRRCCRRRSTIRGYRLALPRGSCDAHFHVFGPRAVLL